jgi:hypothetical protein
MVSRCTTNNLAKSTKRRSPATASAWRNANVLLKRIEAGLERHSVQQAAAPEDCTHAGDLGHVTEELANIVAFLGDEATENPTKAEEETERSRPT